VPWPCTPPASAVRVRKTASWSSLFVTVFIVAGACSSLPLQASDVTVTAQPEVQASSSSSPSVASEAVSPPSTSASLPATQNETVPARPEVLMPQLFISQAAPTQVAIPEIGYAAQAGEMTTDGDGNIDPPTLEDIYVISNVGGLPGTNTGNTVYLACHAWLGHDAPCNSISQKAASGQQIQVTTANGILSYVVQGVKLFGKNGEFYNSADVRAKVSGRLVIVTCFYDADGNSTKNIVVFAQLSSWR